MLHQKFNEGKKARGRPFVKGNRKGKPPMQILDDSRCEISNVREVVEVEPINEIGEDLKPKEIENKVEGDEIVFTNGENKLSIRFFKCNQRRFHIKIFLNDTMEIRPMNFVGGKSGRSTWNLLKDRIVGNNGIDKETH